MKKIIFFSTLLLLQITLLMAQQANNGKDPKAESILNAMSDKYKKMTAFKAEFTYSLKSAAEGIEENLSGNITVKGDKFRLRLGGQEIFNNQTTVWTYLKDDNEVTISDHDANDGDISITEIYNMHKKGFKYLFIEEKKEGTEIYEIVDLTPEDKSQTFFKVRLTINKKTKELKNWQIFEKNGRRFSYNITKLVPNVIVADSYFNFDKSQYPNVKEIDLR